MLLVEGTLLYYVDDWALTQIAQKMVESPSLKIFRSYLDMVLDKQF